jgi:glucokinase
MMEPLSIGCDVGGSGIKVAALRGNRVLLTRRFPPPPRDRRGAVSSIESAVQEAAATAFGDVPRRLRHRPTLGLALPGFLDAARGRSLHSLNLPQLEGLALRALLARRTGWPVILEADSNAGGLGEALLGAGRGARRLLYLSLGTGVGAALIASRQVVRVSHHTVGQVAHLPVDREGPRCSCGSRGCLESVLGAGGIVWRARRAARRGADLPPAARSSPAGLEAAAQGGSRDARSLLREAGQILGAALALLSNLFSPDRVVVGGGIAGAGDLLLRPAERVLMGRLHPRLRGRLTLERARLTPFSGAVGAALLSRERPPSSRSRSSSS